MADGSSGLHVVDVSEPFDTAFVRLDTPGWASGVAVLDQTAYVADIDGGLHIIDVSDLRNPAIVGSVVTPVPVHLVEVLGQTAYVMESVEGPQDEFGLQIIDVSDPLNPVIVGSVNTPGLGVAISVLDHTAYVADGWSGLQIVDVSDPQNPAIVGSLGTTNVTTDVAVSGQTAYVADGNNGLRVVDVSDQLRPTILASVSTPEFAYGVAIQDQTAYVADGFGGLRVVDVSEPTNLVTVGSLPIPNFRAEGIAVLGSTVYMEDYEIGIIAIDISDRSNPVVMGVIDIPGHAEDVAASDAAAYVASGEAGLTIIQVPVENLPGSSGRSFRTANNTAGPIRCRALQHQCVRPGGKRKADRRGFLSESRRLPGAVAQKSHRGRRWYRRPLRPPRGSSPKIARTTHIFPFCPRDIPGRISGFWPLIRIGTWTATVC